MFLLAAYDDAACFQVAWVNWLGCEQYAGTSMQELVEQMANGQSCL